uniref:Uncharacterized protein n=1 Tax=Setaria viridis TaxID=4556 RepID=A0A4U6UF56_SETVI|nr:hypothetical protein SEVIR_6G065825v2 [Setaria viridis]
MSVAFSLVLLAPSPYSLLSSSRGGGRGDREGQPPAADGPSPSIRRTEPDGGEPFGRSSRAA